MDTKTLKENILSGKLTDEEIHALLERVKGQDKEEGLFQSLVRSVLDSYTVPKKRKLIIEAILIVSAISAIIVLSYTGRIDTTITAVLIAFSLGFLFGRIR